MKQVTFITIIIFVLSIAVGVEVPANVQYEIERQQRAMLQREIELDLSRRKAALGSLDRHSETMRRNDALGLKSIKEMYRTPTREEMALLAPENADTAKYSDILKPGRSGLIKLMPDLGCDDLTLQTTRSPKCDQFTLPGGGSGFSFRSGSHRQWLLADLIFDGRHFIAFGQYSQGFMTRLPASSIEDVNLGSEGVRFIADFVPADQQDAVSQQNLQFVQGVRDGTFTYAKLLPAADDHVYVLRSIAYRGRVIRQSLGGVPYNELDFDKRGDIIVAFRVVRRSPDGSITLLWKELQRKEAPKM